MNPSYLPHRVTSKCRVWVSFFDGVLIKDNHIAAAGSISKALAGIKARVPHTLRIEVEVEDTKGVEEAIGAGADAILLDNMTLK